jgi:hypothetical protein
VEKIVFATNVAQEVALRFLDGKECPSNYGDPQVMFTTTDDRMFFVSQEVARRIRNQIAELRVEAGEPLDICKAEVSRGNGRKGIEWRVSKVGTPPVGEQPNGTFVVPAQPATGVVAPAAVQAASQPLTTASNGNGSTNGHGGNGHAASVAAPAPVPPERAKTKLEDALKTVVAAIQATREYAKQIGYDMPTFNGDEIVRMVNTLMINGKNGGANG